MIDRLSLLLTGQSVGRRFQIDKRRSIIYPLPFKVNILEVNILEVNILDEPPRLGVPKFLCEFPTTYCRQLSIIGGRLTMAKHSVDCFHGF